MTTPISGGSGGSSLPPVSGFTAIEATPSYPVLIPGLLITQDSLEESSSSIPIIVYARAINEAIDQLKAQLGASAVQDQEVSKKFFDALIQRATLLQQLYYEVKEAAKLQERLIKERNEQIRLMNEQVDLYNEGVAPQYLGSWEDLKALRDLYSATLNFINPSSSNYLNKTYMDQQVNIYGALTGSPMETLKTAVSDFYSPQSPYYNDFIRLGGVLQQYFFQYDDYVVPANEQTAVDTWAAFFNPESALYNNLGALDSAVKAYAPFLDSSYTLIVEPDIKEINEQDETARVNQAIEDFNNPLSIYYQDTDYLALIYSQYNAYREGTLDDVRNAINAYFAITNRTPEDLDNLDEILRAYHRYIEGAPDIIASLDAYDHDLSQQIQAMIDSHNALVPSSGGPSSEQTAIDNLEAAIAAYYNPISPAFNDAVALQSAIDTYNAYIAARNTVITNFNAEMVEWYDYYNLLIGEQPIKDHITFTPRVLMPPPPAGFPPAQGSTLPDRVEAADLPDQTDPPDADIDALEADIQAYLAYINTDPPNDLNRNAIIEQLNDYVDQYNSMIAANNADIDRINGTRGKLKLKGLTKQDPIDYRDLLPIPPGVYNGSQLLPGRDLYPRVPLITEPTENDTSMTDAFNAEFDEALLFIGTMSQQLNLSQVDIDYALFVFQGGNLMNPLALTPDIGARQQSGGGVAGMGYGSTALDLSNIFVEAILSSALLEAAYKGEAIPDSPDAIEAFKIATLQLLQDISLVSGAPSVAFLAGALPSISLLPYLGIDEAAVSVVFAVEYARQVRNVLLSDVPQQTIRAIIASDPVFGNLTPEQISNLVGSISASLSASLGLVSLVQISIALGTPGLTAQLLSLLPGIQALGVNVLSPPIFQDFVGNGFTSSLVGSLLIGSGLDKSAAAEALRAALASGPADPNSFFTALQKALAAAGVAPSEAIALALDATLLVLQQSPQTNFTQGELDRALLPGVIDQKMLEEALLREFVNAGEIAAAVFRDLNERNQIEKSVLLSNILEDFRFTDELTRGLLRANLLGDSVLRDSIVRDIITQNIIRNDVVLRDIRDAIVRELINREFDIKRAFETAQRTIDELRDDYRLSLRLEQSYIDQEVLKNSIQQSFIQRGLQEDEAIRRAEIVVDNLQNDRENFDSRSNVRTAIRDTLVEEFGIDRQQAGLIAAGVDLGIPPPEPVALFNPGVGSMTINQLIIALETRIMALLGGRLGVEKTEELIDRLKGIVITDDNSLRNVIERSADFVVNTQNEELIRSLAREIEQLTKPNREIFAFMEKLRDPGNALIFSVWSGIMYAQDQPSNYKRDIDIHV